MSFQPCGRGVVIGVCFFQAVPGYPEADGNCRWHDEVGGD